MPLAPDVVRRKLLAIDQAVSRLRTVQPVTVERMQQDGILEWAVERGLQIAAESLFDAGSHILSGHFREVADRYADIAPRLAAHGVITPATSQRLASLSTFRNILVHHYASLDLVKVVQGLERLTDFEAFIGDVERWLGTLAH